MAVTQSIMSAQFSSLNFLPVPKSDTADNQATLPPAVDSMAASIDVHDWATTPLGALEAWPVALHASVRMMLKSSVPVFVAWGSELTFLYNDAFAATLGAGRSSVLGRAFQQVWVDVQPLIDRVLSGEIVSMESMPFT